MLLFIIDMRTRKEIHKIEKAILKKSVEAPAQALDKTIAIGNQLNHSVPMVAVSKKSKDYWHMLGPGFTTGASDDDPSGIATYSQAGAQFGFQTLWLSIFTFPLMSVVQEMCARIGIVTGRGLAANIRRHFPKKIIYISALLLFAANAFNIGANLGAMAQAVQMLNPRIAFWPLVVGFTALSFGLQIFTPYVRYARYLKWLALMLLAYIASAFMANLDWGNVLQSAVTPSIHFDKNYLLILCAILGTTISPYLFFWQTSQEVEEQILQGKTKIGDRQGADAKDIKGMRVDVWSGMLLSNIVMFFIIATCGALLFGNGITDIKTASQAAEALRPFAGDATYLLFAIGIIGTGMLSIPVLAGASSYALAESFKWREGLYYKLHQAHAFYGLIIISMMIGMALNFIGLDPFKTLIYSAVVNGLVAPVILALIVIISSNKKVMGEWVNKRSTTVIGWFVTILMALAGAGAIYALL